MIVNHSAALRYMLSLPLLIVIAPLRETRAVDNGGGLAVLYALGNGWLRRRRVVGRCEREPGVRSAAGNAMVGAVEDDPARTRVRRYVVHHHRAVFRAVAPYKAVVRAER